MIYYGISHIHFLFGVVSTLFIEYIALLIVYVVLKRKNRKMKMELEDLEWNIEESALLPEAQKEGDSNADHHD